MFNQLKHLRDISNRIDECECLICNRVFNRYSELATHLKFAHNVSSKEYYDKYILIDKNICICGNERKFRSIKHGYNRYCGMDCGQKNKGSDNPNYGKRRKNPEHSKRMMGNKFAKGSLGNKGKKLNISENGRKALVANINRLNSRGFENKGGRCQFFSVNGMTLQGRYELYYYLTSKENLTKPELIQTPYGFYTPDFETEERYIEIKSTFTIKTCFKGKQIEKIKWVRKNIKPLTILVLDEMEVHNFLSEIDIKQYKQTK